MSWRHWSGSAHRRAILVQFMSIKGPRSSDKTWSVGYTHGVTQDFSRPGKPRIVPLEAFTSTLRAEYLNAHWFMSLADARQKRVDWL